MPNQNKTWKVYFLKTTQYNHIQLPLFTVHALKIGMIKYESTQTK